MILDARKLFLNEFMKTYHRTLKIKNNKNFSERMTILTRWYIDSREGFKRKIPESVEVSQK